MREVFTNNPDGSLASKMVTLAGWVAARPKFLERALTPPRPARAADPCYLIATGGTAMKIVKTKDVAWADSMQRGNFGQRRKELGSTGKLSAGLWELSPGKKSFPFHMHHITEEALFVVSGSAKVRTADGLTPISAGDWVMFPPGDGAHQLINDGAEPMVYVALGVGMGVDIVEYPDSGKISSAVFAPERKRFIFKKDTQVDYFADEEDAK
jgi:uncharacterized cupin superfamily protein